MGLTLDDLRSPGFGTRLWGYDRDEVDQLLASVVVSVERFQRRRQRDADAVSRAKAEARTATARAERLEHERAELASRVELADQALERAVAEATQRAEQRVAEAEERAARAEQALVAAQSAGTAVRAAPAAAAGDQGLGDGGDVEPAFRLPLALRAARVLLAEARARAAAIEAEAARDPSGQIDVEDGGKGPGQHPPAPIHS